MKKKHILIMLLINTSKALETAIYNITYKIEADKEDGFDLYVEYMEQIHTNDYSYMLTFLNKWYKDKKEVNTILKLILQRIRLRRQIKALI